MLAPTYTGKQIKWMGRVLEVWKGYYQRGDQGIALILLDPANRGTDFAVATVNLVREKLEEGEVFIKDYSENEGVLEALMIGGVVYPPHRKARTGFVEVPCCKLV